MIIGLLGQARVGKDSVAVVMQQQLKRCALRTFAQPIKEFCRYSLGVPSASLWGPSERRNDVWHVREDGSPVTVRDALKEIGDAGRRLDAKVWVKRAMESCRRSARLGYDHVVLTDCRYLNEIWAITDAGGQIIRVTRPGVGGKDATHSSELEQTSQEVEGHIAYDLVNDGGLEDLDEKVREALDAIGATI